MRFDDKDVDWEDEFYRVSADVRALRGEVDKLRARARLYGDVLAALRHGQNAKLPFGQVMADLGLDSPPLDAPV